MIRRQKRVPYTEYQEAFDKFTELRREVNDCIYNSPEKFDELFTNIKRQALYGSVIAMDILAYYYKKGIPEILPENYNRYLVWEILAAARGNIFAIEKIKFMLDDPCLEISEHERFDDIIYKNDITEENVMHVLGKAVCKIVVKDFLKAFPIDLIQLEDDFDPYTQDSLIKIREIFKEAVPKTIDYLLS